MSERDHHIKIEQYYMAFSPISPCHNAQTAQYQMFLGLVRCVAT